MGVLGLAEEKLQLEVFWNTLPQLGGMKAQQDVLQEIPHVLLRDPWEEGFRDWWVGLFIHSINIYGVCSASPMCPQGRDGPEPLA